MGMSLGMFPDHIEMNFAQHGFNDKRLKMFVGNGFSAVVGSIGNMMYSSLYCLSN